MEGRKDDGGKLPWHLMPPDALNEILLVLQFGAKKYSTVVENEWHALLIAPTVKSINISTRTGLVVAVMKNSCGKPILSLLNVNAKTGEIGNSVTDTVCENWQTAEKMILSVVCAMRKQKGGYGYQNTASLKKRTKNCAKKDVLYAGLANTFILTIVTERGDFVVSFAPDAITDSDFWTIVWKGLKELYGISKPQSKTGERNWEQGMAWSRPFSALMRHMWAWWRGEDFDHETGYSHLAHAGCCILFLMTYRGRAIGVDDRPIHEVKP